MWFKKNTEAADNIISSINKYAAETVFWQKTLQDYLRWYRGELKILYGEKTPTENRKVKVTNEQDSAILTWEKIHQQHKYLDDLKLKASVFNDSRLLDIGSGPHPSARVFSKAKMLYCLDPLLSEYIRVGFPLHYYDRVKFIASQAEKMPLPSRSIDAIISVNALDHVDDFEQVAKEIRRILKPNGKMRFHLHYHKKTIEEPIELTDARVKQAFSWDKNFYMVASSKKKRGTKLVNKDENYVLWSNW
jgi:ubiquinone/menaquinone biosynthesis C-methylase UbiE